MNLVILIQILFSKKQILLFHNQHGRVLTQFISGDSTKRSMVSCDLLHDDPEFLESQMLHTKTLRKNANAQFDQLRDLKIESQITRKLLLGVFP